MFYFDFICDFTQCYICHKNILFVGVDVSHLKHKEVFTICFDYFQTLRGSRGLAISVSNLNTYNQFLPIFNHQSFFLFGQCQQHQEVMG